MGAGAMMRAPRLAWRSSMGAQHRSRRYLGTAWRTLAHAGTAALMILALILPASILPAGAQFWGQWDSRQQQRPQRQQEFNPFGGWFGNPRDSRPRREPQRDSTPD